MAYQKLEVSEGGDVTVAHFATDASPAPPKSNCWGRNFTGWLKRENISGSSSTSRTWSTCPALLGKLISLNAKVRAGNGNIKLCSIRPEVFNIFHTCMLDRIFSISKDLADAWPSF